MKKRSLIQLIFFVLAIAVLSFVIIVGKKSIHNICPYAIICFGLMKGNIINLGLGLAALGILLGIVFMIVSMYYGRIFCGYICPLGSYQEWIYAAFGKSCKKQLPLYYERVFSKIKYLILLLTILLVITGFAWIYMQFCPFYALSRLPSVAIGGILMLGIITIGSLFFERFWCRFLCPYAALLNIAQKVGKLFSIPRRKVHRNLERCCDCGMCSANCPMNLDILADEYVQSEDCIHCLRCAKVCPKSGTITVKKEK